MRVYANYTFVFWIMQANQSTWRDQELLVVADGQLPKNVKNADMLSASGFGAGANIAKKIVKIKVMEIFNLQNRGISMFFMSNANILHVSWQSHPGAVLRELHDGYLCGDNTAEIPPSKYQ